MSIDDIRKAASGRNLGAIAETLGAMRVLLDDFEAGPFGVPDATQVQLAQVGPIAFPAGMTSANARIVILGMCNVFGLGGETPQPGDFQLQLATNLVNPVMSNVIRLAPILESDDIQTAVVAYVSEVVPDGSFSDPVTVTMFGAAPDSVQKTTRACQLFVGLALDLP